MNSPLPSLGRRRFASRLATLAAATAAGGCVSWNDLGWDKEKDKVTQRSTGQPESRRGAPAPIAGRGDRVLRLASDIALALVYVPPGRFVMGSPESEPGRSRDERQHDVVLTQGFWLGRTEVTQRQWAAVMKRTVQEQRALAGGERRDAQSGVPALPGEGPEHPIHYVSWDEAAEFCRRVNTLESEQGRVPSGYGCWLPTEAQWEYACRAGSSGPHGAGGTLDELAWYAGNAGGGTHPVATKAPNAWGLFDMQGNVREWCADYYGENAQGTAIDPYGPEAGDGRVARGGALADLEQSCRAAQRSRVPGNRRYPGLGLRLALRPM
jgi:formylglycine-generating enzyme required for sulfatase activity